MHPTLSEMITACDEKGFDVQPVREGKHFRFVIWKDKDVFKIGQKKYKSWHTGQTEVYKKLFSALRR